MNFKKYSVFMACAGFPWIGLCAYTPPVYPYAPEAGADGSTAIVHNDPAFSGWATGVASIEYGLEVSEVWKTPEAALGPVDLSGLDVVVLGRGGVIELEFAPAIRDGAGDDFAVFENSFSDTFLELAFVEVSSDGEHYVRFPNYSLTDSAIPGFGVVSPTFVHGFAGKYRSGFGTPFNLSVLEEAHAAVLSGYVGFSGTFEEQLVANFTYLDLQNVRYVRLIDIAGDGSSFDCEGWPIYDPYPTVITAGFDLEAVGVLNQVIPVAISFEEWSTAHQLEAIPSEDSDGDGWSQYLEYYFGSDPVDPLSLPSIMKTISSSGTFVLEYWKRQGAGDAIGIFFSEKGSAWTQTDGAEIEALETWVFEGEWFVRERLEIDATSPSLFVRFLLSEPTGS